MIGRRLRAFGMLLAAALALALAWVGAVALLGDAELVPGARDALAARERLPRERNRFNALSGFTVAPGVDPAVAGHDAVTRVNALLSSPDHVSEAAVRSAWVEPALRVADPGGVLCPPPEPGCLRRLAARGDALRALAGRNDVLLARYGALAAYPEHRNELVAHPAMPLPRFHDLLEVHRLWLGLRLADAVAGAPATHAAVHEDVRFLRRMLVQADDLIGKMVAAAMLAESAAVLAALMDVPGADPAAFAALAPLTAGERSLDAALRWEFRFGAAAVGSLRGRDVLAADLGIPAWLGEVALRPLFKPVRTVNAAWRCMQAARAAAARPPAALLAEPAGTDARGCEQPWQEWLLNPVGAILVGIAAPDFSRYALRMHDLDGLLTLVNLKRAMRAAGVDAAGAPAFLAGEGARFAGPYDGRPAAWDAEGGTLRFASPSPGGGRAVLPLDPLGPAGGG